MTEIQESARRVVSVRDLVEFVHRSGGLAGTGSFSSYRRAQEGAEGHRQVQSQRGEGYESEVSVSDEWDGNGVYLKVQGRIDGVFNRGDDVVLEEIKTVKKGWDGSPREIHWAQAKVYGAILCKERSLESLRIQLTYLELENDHLVEFQEEYLATALEEFYLETIQEFALWMKGLADWKIKRDASLAGLEFPFAEYRRGQRRLAVEVYRHMRDGERLFAEAPTGIGKTMSVLYPSLKALGEDAMDRLFYLTARTLGRTVVESALELLRERGARVRSVTLTAKESLCFTPEGESRCDLRKCPYAIGYYDRIKDALMELLDCDGMTRQEIERIAKAHTVCPHELSLDAAVWSDLVIGDFNHAFDPRARLIRFFETKGDERKALLIDEAHHLPDRGREMFSAELSRADMRSLKKAIGRKVRDVSVGLEKVLSAMKEVRSVLPPAKYEKGRRVRDRDAEEAVVHEPDIDLLKALKQLVRGCELWLLRDEEAPFKEELRNVYYASVRFVQVWDEVDERFSFLVRRVGRDIHFKWFCMDPSKDIGAVLDDCAGVIFFSATLAPMDYFVSLSGCEEDTDSVRLASPFPPENLRLKMSIHVGTSYREREGSLTEVADLIGSTLAERPGNALVFFPSYRYMEQVAELAMEKDSVHRWIIQETGMSEDERAEFLNAFQEEGDSVVGCAVMGGIFGEGIDLVGERLTTAIIVGVGLPQVCLERELIREHFVKKGMDGFAYAYRYPGMTRVLQAAGRVIRTETDQGTVHLIDRRYFEHAYRELLPPWWEI